MPDLNLSPVEVVAIIEQRAAFVREENLMPFGLENYRDPTSCIRGTLLDAVGQQDDGKWVKVEGFEKKTVHIVISNTATAQVRVSNEDAPADNTDGIKYGNDYTASALAEVKVPVKWIKVKVSAWTSGTVSAFLQGCP